MFASIFKEGWTPEKRSAATAKAWLSRQRKKTPRPETSKDASHQLEDLEPARVDDHVRGVQVVVNDVAKARGFPLNKIYMSQVERPFEVNGTKYMTAGLAYFESGTIVVMPSQLGSVKAAERLMAHEVAHHEYEQVSRALGAERSALMKDPAVTSGGYGLNSGMKPDGSLRTPELQAKYPLYSKLHPVYESPEAFRKLEKEDGVTQYSRDYWEAYKKGEVTRHQAEHETFAEISSLVQGLSDVPLDTALKAAGVKPSWRKLYKAYQEAFTGFLTKPDNPKK